jgi:hypothetical protein
MPKYLVLEQSFINNTLVEAGAEVEYDGEPSGNLELIDALDHDGDGRKGGSKKGAESTRAKGAAATADDPALA